MTQAQTFIEIMATLAKSDPKAHQVFSHASMPSIVLSVGEWLSTEGTEFPFKPRPAKGPQFCYIIAEWNYSLNIYTCSLITDPNIRKACQISAKESYCEAYDLCGDPA